MAMRDRATARAGKSMYRKNCPGLSWKVTKFPGTKTRRVMPKRKQSRMPTKTGGMDMQIWLNTVMNLSSQLPSRFAARIPSGNEAATVMPKAMRTSAAVAGSFSITMSFTGML